mmetsp:Transcript_3987/g.13960  ORF Transcript_3987/g.13960 Transcript_3987/m.13960 type:complete len:498 (-) Transcript_3987:607-2100(-)
MSASEQLGQLTRDLFRLKEHKLILLYETVGAHERFDFHGYTGEKLILYVNLEKSSFEFPTGTRQYYLGRTSPRVFKSLSQYKSYLKKLLTHDSSGALPVINDFDPNFSGYIIDKQDLFTKLHSNVREMGDVMLFGRKLVTLREKWVHSYLEDKIFAASLFKEFGFPHVPYIAGNNFTQVLSHARKLNTTKQVWNVHMTDGPPDSAGLCLHIVDNVNSLSEEQETLFRKGTAYKVMPYVDGIGFEFSCVILPSGETLILGYEEVVTLVCHHADNSTSFLFVGSGTTPVLCDLPLEHLESEIHKFLVHVKERFAYVGVLEIGGVWGNEGFLATELNARNGGRGSEALQELEVLLHLWSAQASVEDSLTHLKGRLQSFWRANCGFKTKWPATTMLKQISLKRYPAEHSIFTKVALRCELNNQIVFCGSNEKPHFTFNYFPGFSNVYLVCCAEFTFEDLMTPKCVEIIKFLNRELELGFGAVKSPCSWQTLLNIKNQFNLN